MPKTENQDVEVQDPGRTEFSNLAEAIEAAAQNLKAMPTLNPQTLRLFLLNEICPILVDFAQHAHWYVADLHSRVSDIEEEVGGGEGEGIDPEFANQLIEFIGVSLQLFGVLVNVCKSDQEVISKVQLLIAQAPGLIAKIQEITLEEVDEDEEEDEEEDDIEVLEPQARRVTSQPPAESTPVAPPVEQPQETVATMVPDAVQEIQTNAPSPGVVVTPPTNQEPNNG